MNTATIEDLAYLIKQAKEEGLPQPIVFLGAGASKTGGVPLASEIIADILEKYKHSPKIKSLGDDLKTYSKLMACLTPFERNKLLKEYIDRAQINVTHIYLAQLLIEGFVDYVLTVNFDNLMLRALALYNNFPATYDMAILKDLTTTSFKEKSVVYLHGQHHGLWLLNTEEEMAKVKEIIPPILNSIKNQRPWIFIGYSGDDPIFEHIIKLGRFDNGLYWITYHDGNPNDLVCNELLEKSNTNAFLIKGYDADSFMLKLNRELNLPQPLIIDKPFTSLKNTLDSIVDIDDKEHFKGVKERLVIVKNDVAMAIQQFEEGKVKENSTLKKEIDINLLKKQIIDRIVSGTFNEEEVRMLERNAKAVNNPEIDSLMSNLFLSWGSVIKEDGYRKGEIGTLSLSIEKYKRAIELDHKNYYAYSSWGNSISQIAKDTKNEALFNEAFEKYKIATELFPEREVAFINWGNSIFDLAGIKKDENLFEESIKKYNKAIEINPKSSSTFSNLGNALSELAELRKDEKLFEDSFEKFAIAVELSPTSASTFNNWGSGLSDLAALKKDEKIYRLSVEKYEKAVELSPSDDIMWRNLGYVIGKLAELKKEKDIFRSAFEKFQKAIELNPKSSRAFSSWATSLSQLAELTDDIKLYELSCEKYERAAKLNPLDDICFGNWGIALQIIGKLKKDENYLKISFEKYKIAAELNPKDANTVNNWGNAIFDLAKMTNDAKLFSQCYDKFIKAKELGASGYNLGCYYAQVGEKERALELLEESLLSKDVNMEFVNNDSDWSTLRNENNFRILAAKYA